MNLERRLRALEAAPLRALGRYRGMATYMPGQRPLDALNGLEPGLWLLLDHHLNGPALLVRVSRDGKRKIYGGHHATT